MNRYPKSLKASVCDHLTGPFVSLSSSQCELLKALPCDLASCLGNSDARTGSLMLFFDGKNQGIVIEDSMVSLSSLL